MMTKKTFLTTSALVGAGLLALTSCAASDADGALPPVTVTMNADYPDYDSVTDLTTSADVVVTGAVESSKTVVLYPDASDSSDPVENPFAGASDEEEAAARAESGVVTTVSSVRVETVVKGDVAVGDIIEVSQLGGTVTEKVQGKTQEVTYVSPDTTILEDVPTESVLLMLASYDGGAAYDLLNPIQAVYAVESDTNIEAVSSDSSALQIDSLAQVEESVQ